MDIVIFGTQNLSKLAWFQFKHDSPHRVVAFVMHERFIREPTFMDLPVVPFERLSETHPPGSVEMSVPIGWRGMNGLRASVFAEARDMGYQFASYVSSRASVWPDLSIGENCIIAEGASVQPFTRIGDNCIIRLGAIIGHDSIVENHCFIASGVITGGSCVVGRSSVLGLGATIRDRTKIAEQCMIGAGAVVVADTKAEGLYLGVPAKRMPGSVYDVDSMN